MNQKPDATSLSAEPFHRKHRNVFVGLFILIPLIILPVFLVYTFLRTDILEQWWFLHVKYASAAGLAKGTAVTIRGMKVGYIQTVSLNRAGRIDVDIKLQRGYASLVKKDSRARLQQKNIAFGDWEIELTEGTAQSPPVADGDTLESLVQAPLAKTLDQVTRTVETLQKILQQILDGKGTAGRLIMEDTLVDLAQDVARSARSLILRAHGTLGRADTLIRRVSAIGDRGTMLADSMVGITAKVSTLVTDVNQLVGSVQTTARDIPGLMNRVQGDIAEVELLLKALQNNWLIRGGIKGQPDPMQNDNPSR
jgi:phospholipid/cholesterol/gamma-HCH transport system substrate-binding protein